MDLTPHSPWSNPLFAKVALRTGAALLLLLAGALHRERRRRREPDERSLLAPVATVAVIIALFLPAMFAGGVALDCFVAVTMLLGLREYARLTRLDRGYTMVLTGGSVVGLCLASFGSAALLPLLPIGVFLAATSVPILSGQVSGAHRQVGGVVFGYVYIGLPMAYLIFIRSAEPWGLGFLLIVIAAAWLADTCAYTVGSKVKGPKLAPTVSPGKTWSGAAGSLLGTVLGVALINTVVEEPWRFWRLVVLGSAIAVSAVWGDLVESVVKRDFEAKDAGAILPGFGGVLDRFDSVLVTIPVAYYVVLGSEHLGR